MISIFVSILYIVYSSTKIVLNMIKSVSVLSILVSIDISHFIDFYVITSISSISSILSIFFQCPGQNEKSGQNANPGIPGTKFQQLGFHFLDRNCGHGSKFCKKFKKLSTSRKSFNAVPLDPGFLQ